MEGKLRVIVGSFVALASFVAVSAQAAPVVSKAAIAERGAAPQIELIRQGCGPGWHRAGWRDHYGYWHWGRCVPY
jgi:hypothetical protein